MSRTKARIPKQHALKAWAAANAELAVTICEAMANFELTKQRVDAYIKPIFDRYEFICEGPAAERFDASPRKGDTKKYVGRRIASPEGGEFWMIHGDDMPEAAQVKLRAYYAECDAAHRAHGYTDLEPGHCPALSAGHLVTQAENALIESARELFNIEVSDLMSDQRKKYIDLLLSACIQADDDAGGHIAQGRVEFWKRKEGAAA